MHNLEVAPDLRNLFQYLIDKGRIEQLDNHDEKCLGVFSRDVLAQIAKGSDSWEEMVPPEVAEVIKKQGYFGARRQL